MIDSRSNNLFAAALLLPGLASSFAQAQTPPDSANLAFRLLDYRDWQPGAERMRSSSPAFRLLAPAGASGALEVSLMHDAVSGASPLYHHTLSGASGKGVNDHRTAGDAKYTHYFENDALAASFNASSERDYLSRGAGIEWRRWSADRNTAFTLAVGGSDDRIDLVNGVARDSRRRTQELLLGLTQVISPVDLLQVNLFQGRGEGYFSDPYKPLDARPSTRDTSALQARYHHHVTSLGASVRLAYRYYRDSWAVRAHTLDAAWHQPLAQRWWIMPGLRYYTQSAAFFYHDPPFPQGWSLGSIYTADTRLAAFGAWSPSLSLGREFGEGWHFDLRYELYRQRAEWRPGSGSPGLQPFSARAVSFGLARDF